MDIIRLENISKKFGGFIAVDSISFSVSEGEIFGFLGPNGAGKTTTISMLSTLLAPTSGEASVNGFNVKTQMDEVRKSIGVVFQDPSLDEELTAFENMDLHGRLYRVPATERKQKIKDLLGLVDLSDRANDLVKTFSGGMRRRLEIARGLLHEPKVLFLDEPTLGLDPQTRNLLWDYIRRLNSEKGMTIVVTTHYMDEADRLCRRVAIIDHGKIVALDTPANLKDKIGGDVVNIQSMGPEKLLSAVKEMPWFVSAKPHDGFLSINVKNAEKRIAEIAEICRKKDIEISSISMNKPTLEDVFLFYTGRLIREEEATSKDHMRMMRRMWKR